MSDEKLLGCTTEELLVELKARCRDNDREEDLLKGEDCEERRRRWSTTHCITVVRASADADGPQFAIVEFRTDEKGDLVSMVVY